MATKSYIGKPLNPIVRKEIDKFAKEFEHTDSNGVSHSASPELLKELENRLKLEQVRCETMTKDSIAGDRRKRAAITFGGTVAGGILICVLTGSPIGLALFAAPAIQAAISLVTIRLSRNKRLEGAAGSVSEMIKYEVANGKIGLDGKPLKKQLTKEDEQKQDQAAIETTKKILPQVLKENHHILSEDPELRALLLASLAKPDEGNSRPQKAQEPKEVNKVDEESKLLGIARQNPDLFSGFRASKVKENAEGALPIPAFYGISNGANLQQATASVF